MIFILEKQIEKYFKKEIEKLGGLCLKFNSSVKGVPDRIVLMPKGLIYFVEFKQQGKKLRELQNYMKKQLQGLGFKFYVVDCGVQAMLTLKEIKDDQRRV